VSTGELAENQNCQNDFVTIGKKRKIRMITYWIAHVTVTDPVAYAAYQAAANGVFDAHGGAFVARGGESTTLEGAAFQRHVVIAFPSRAQAEACYNSAQYRQARILRAKAAEVQITLVDGI
jgi:uncharacterized protein (DUF1330 family)